MAGIRTSNETMYKLFGKYRADIPNIVRCQLQKSNHILTNAKLSNVKVKYHRISDIDVVLDKKIEIRIKYFTEDD